MSLLNHIRASFLAGQYGHPTGLVGRLLGERMVRQHMAETAWTISLLNLQPKDQILELGFGAGRAIELIAAQAVNGHVFGVDLSQEMMRSASRRNAKAIKAGQVVLCHGDLTPTNSMIRPLCVSRLRKAAVSVASAKKDTTKLKLVEAKTFIQGWLAFTTKQPTKSESCSLPSRLGVQWQLGSCFA
jgi:SAM-dependent methyltransferase